MTLLLATERHLLWVARKLSTVRPRQAVCPRVVRIVRRQTKQFATTSPHCSACDPLLSLHPIVQSQTLSHQIHAIVQFLAICRQLLSLFGVRSFAVIACHCSASSPFLPFSRDCSLSGLSPSVVHHCSVPDPLMSLHPIVRFRRQALCYQFHAIVHCQIFPASCPSLFRVNPLPLVTCARSLATTPLSKFCTQ